MIFSRSNFEYVPNTYHSYLDYGTIFFNFNYFNYSKNLKFALEIFKFVNLVDVKQSDILKNNLAYALE